MDEYPKTGFQRFRETKMALPAGMLAALLISLGIVLLGINSFTGLIVSVLSFFILRSFGIRKIEYHMIYAAILFAALTLLISTIWEDDIGTLLYNVFIVFVLPFIVISLLVFWMRKNLEKTRERLEKEGRLYPPGYGRCKKCGTVVLPGEICCRRCGEYIDVPEEMRVKKVNYFECSECGREVPEDAGVCPYCGEVFDDDGESDDPRLNPPA